MNLPIRHGDVILIPIEQSEGGQELSHLVLAEGEVTGHCHQISAGRAKLIQRGSVLYLQVLSESALLTHEEHHPLSIPAGHWLVRKQREYKPSPPSPQAFVPHPTQLPLQRVSETELDEMTRQNALRKQSNPLFQAHPWAWNYVAD